jgi:hypothetical protein
MSPDAWTPVRAPKAQPDYQKASPDEIRSDIEKTRAHMDETLVRLGRKIRPRFFRDRRKVIAAVTLLLLAAGGLVFLRIRSGRGRPEARAMGWRKARLYEQFLVMRGLIAAARKGKPAVFVVEPKKLR